MAEYAPRFYTDPAQWAEEVAGQYTLHQATVPRLNTLIVSDVDEVVIDSAGRWYTDFVGLAIEKGLNPDSLPNLEMFVARTPRACFTELGIVDDYSAYKANQMHNIAFHLGMEALDSAAAVLPRFSQLNLPGGYVSTRPAALGEATQWHLAHKGLPLAPLLVRPEHIPYEATIAFKLEAMRTLRSAMDEAAFTNVSLEYVDDYRAVVDAINHLQQDGLAATHFGPHTSWQEIANRYTENGGFTSMHT